jgi:hypothetical protein
MELRDPPSVRASSPETNRVDENNVRRMLRAIWPICFLESVRVGGVRAQLPYGRFSDFAGGHTAPIERRSRPNSAL